MNVERESNVNTVRGVCKAELEGWALVSVPGRHIKAVQKPVEHAKRGPALFRGQVLGRT
jgi:hypothetical protein